MKNGKADAPMAAEFILKEMVAVSFAAQELDRALETLRTWIDKFGDNKRIQYAALAMLLLNEDLGSRLTKLLIRLSEEE